MVNVKKENKTKIPLKRKNPVIYKTSDMFRICCTCGVFSLHSLLHEQRMECFGSQVLFAQCTETKNWKRIHRAITEGWDQREVLVWDGLKYNETISVQCLSSGRTFPGRGSLGSPAGVGALGAGRVFQVSSKAGQAQPVCAAEERSGSSGRDHQSPVERFGRRQLW